MKEDKGRYIVLDTVSKKYIHIASTTFYKTTDIKDATIFSTREKAILKVKREGIHYIVKYKVRKLPEKKGK